MESVRAAAPLILTTKIGKLSHRVLFAILPDGNIIKKT